MRNAPTTGHDTTTTAMLGEAVDLSVGLGIVLLPLLTWAVPGLILMVVLPVVLLLVAAAIPVAVIGAMLAPVYLLLSRRTR